MGVIVHRVDAGIASARDVVGTDAVDHRVAQIDIGRGHVDFQAQGFAAVRLHRPSCGGTGQVFRHAALAVGCFAGSFQRPAIFAHLLGVELAHIGLAGLNQRLGVLVERIKIIRRPFYLAGPLKAPSQRTSAWMVRRIRCFSFPGWCRQSADCTGRGRQLRPCTRPKFRQMDLA